MFHRIAVFGDSIACRLLQESLQLLTLQKLFQALALYLIQEATGEVSQSFKGNLAGLQIGFIDYRQGFINLHRAAQHRLKQTFQLIKVKHIQNKKLVLMRRCLSLGRLSHF
ncbi:MAG: hypothetical protein BWY75_02109 [bacterium ADurb.Bin425]|nr:MAG: hypothetical protein BWY75_02109 [bacterium ADurb.Bin425]